MKVKNKGFYFTNLLTVCHVCGSAHVLPEPACHGLVCVRYLNTVQGFHRHFRFFHFKHSTLFWWILSLFFFLCVYFSVPKHRQTKGNFIPSQLFVDIFGKNINTVLYFPARLFPSLLHHAVAASRPCGLVYVVLNRNRKAYSADY